MRELLEKTVSPLLAMPTPCNIYLLVLALYIPHETAFYRTEYLFYSRFLQFCITACTALPHKHIHDQIIAKQTFEIETT